MNISARFMGVGASHAAALGNSSIAIEKDGAPCLLVDCGFDTLDKFKFYYNNELPKAVFITHCHFDHIGGLEQLYFQSRLSGKKPTLYVPYLLIPTLVNILANTLIAEGNENVWDCLRLVPVQNSFFHQSIQFHSYPVRHHQPNSAFSLHLPHYFFYSGDTRPIPELLNHHAKKQEVIFHDCSIIGNPSHSGLDDLKREYSDELLSRIVVYHYASEDDTHEFLKHKIACAAPGKVIPLPASVFKSHPRDKTAYISRSLNGFWSDANSRALII